MKNKTIMTKLFQILFLTLLLINCKGESKKNVEHKTDVTVLQEEKYRAHNQSLSVNNNCYDYLTELVRSSNFPFASWKVSNDKINLLIDEENNEFVRAKILIDTHGTGTIGWIEYYYKTGKLLNTSAELDNPVELKYDIKWKEIFDDCFFSKNKTTNNNDASSLENVYKNCIELPLPIKYDYDVINEEKGFQPIDKEYYNLFSIEHQDNYKLAKLPIINDNVKPIILITYNENGQSTWYLYVLNNEYKPISNITLYTSEELSNGDSRSTTYSISKDYKINIIKQSNDKVISKKNYVISNEGYIK
jgi:hypothetical protein